MATKRTKREGLLSKLLIAIFQKLFEIEPWNLVLLLIFTVCSKFHWNLKRWFSDMSHFDVEFPSWKRHLFWQKTPLKIHNSVKTWYFDGKIKSFRKLMICFSYFCQKKIFSIRTWSNEPFFVQIGPKKQFISSRTEPTSHFTCGIAAIMKWEKTYSIYLVLFPEQVTLYIISERSAS